MPFTESGIVPDIIMNPHSIPSRMTMGPLIESLFGKLCADDGTSADATIFSKVDVEAIGSELERRGFDRHGEEVMYNGLTGESMHATVFIGPVYYQRLQKFVADARYAVSSGPVCSLTRQPLSGKSSKGGLKIGEMEQDVLFSNGAAGFMQEKFFMNDPFMINICTTCGSSDTVIVNEASGVIKCKTCRDAANIVRVPASWAVNLFIKELRAMNIKTSWTVQPPEFTRPKK